MNPELACVQAIFSYTSMSTAVHRELLEFGSGRVVLWTVTSRPQPVHNLRRQPPDLKRATRAVTWS
jgi:hypothetical protein